jgi:hypothetical protein
MRNIKNPGKLPGINFCKPGGGEFIPHAQTEHEETAGKTTRTDIPVLLFWPHQVKLDVSKTRCKKKGSH